MEADHHLLLDEARDGTADQAASQSINQHIKQLSQQPQQVVCISESMQQYHGYCQPMLGNGQFAMPAATLWKPFSHLGTVPCVSSAQRGANAAVDSSATVAEEAFVYALSASLDRQAGVPVIAVVVAVQRAHLWVENKWRCLLQAVEPADADSLPIMTYSSCIKMANSSTNCALLDISNSLQHTSDQCSERLLQQYSIQVLYCNLPRAIMAATVDGVQGMLRVTVLRAGSSWTAQRSGEVWVEVN
jgi:hypothetical protein